jgi:diadenosine tetraphosphate (Ap4A) HIT family hydrolase
MDSGFEANWSLDSRLERDSVDMCRLPLCQVRLLNDSNYPWLLLVPRRANATEITDLAEPDRTQLMREVSQAVDALKAETNCDKINVAAIGNVVAQLHIHVVARFHTDAVWPKPVWGHVPARAYEPPALQKLVSEMRERLAVTPH